MKKMVNSNYPVLSIVLFLLILFNDACKSQSIKEKNIGILDIITNTLDNEYYDPEFGGIDWGEITGDYRSKIENCRTNDSLYYHLNKMLFNLGVSHLGVVSPEEVNEISDPQLLLDGMSGMDILYIDGKVIITKVFPNTPAYEFNLRPGYQIIEINNENIDDIIRKRLDDPLPPFNERNTAMMITSDVLRYLYGPPGTLIELKYIDSEFTEKVVRFPLIKRTQNKAYILKNMPMIYASVDAKIINKKIGYIHFDVFHPVILDTILKCIRNYQDLPFMIIDLRGNPGGEFSTRKRIAEQFVTERTLFWKYQSRGRINEIYLEPAERPYKGKLIILIDERSSSSSEEFSGGMKAIGRAVIIGKQTAGKVLTMKVLSLPDGALFVYPNKQTLTSNDEILEGRGVVPDISMDLSVKDLLNGKDSQLQAALDFIKNSKEK